MSLNRTVRKLIPCFIIFLILVPTLNSQSLWWDEGISIHLAESSWNTIIEDRASNIHPPLYFFLLKMWLGIAGSTPFSARYLSAMVTTLLPALVYHILKHHFNFRTALTGAYLTSVAPPFIIYGQETRAYAFLPLFFVLLVMQLCQKASPVSARISVSPKLRGILMGITEILFVGFHYTGIFAVVYANLYLIFKAAVRKSKYEALLFIFSIVTMLALSVPWLCVVLVFGLDRVLSQAGISNPLSSGIPLPYLLKLLTVFSIIGLPEALSALDLTRSALISFNLLMITFLLRLFKPGQKQILSLFIIWILPFTFVPVIWLLSPQAHPRYLLPYYLGGWLLIAVLISQDGMAKVQRILLLAATLVSVILGLGGYFFNQTYARSDVRSAAANIKERALEGDIVIIPYTDWSLPQYDTGPAEVIMLPSSQDDLAIAKALDLGARSQSTHIFLLDYDRNALDPSGYVRYALSRQGYLIDRINFHNVFIERYVLSQPYTSPDFKTIPPICVEGEEICLEGADVPDESVSGTMLPIALDWHHGIVENRYALAFRLYTQTGVLVSSADDLLIDHQLLPSDSWTESADFHSYHLLPIPLGLVPQYYKLEISVYAIETPQLSVSLIDQTGKRLPSAEIALTRPALSPWVDASPETLNPAILLTPIHPLPGLTLAGTHIEPSSVAPGDNIYIRLLWYVESEGIPLMNPVIIMNQDGLELSRVNVWGKFGDMPLHRPLLDYVLSSVPLDAKEGIVALQLIADVPGKAFTIGTFNVEGYAHSYEVPEMQNRFKAVIPDIVTLLGFDSDTELVVESGSPVTVTLFWQAGANASQSDIKVFVHLVDKEGNILAQDDSKPVSWTRPTTGWLPGEILVDRHHLAWQQDQVGSGEIVIGLYDAVTGSRFMWENGEDALKLPLYVGHDSEP